MPSKVTPMGRQPGDFKWHEKRIKAAQMFAEGKTSAYIEEALTVAHKTLWEWKCNPVFDARIDEIVARSAKKLEGDGIRNKETRLNNLQRRIDKMHALIDARAQEMQGECAGGDTGLLVRDYKGSGPTMEAVYKFDAALVKELREHEKQAAIEKGDWTEKQQVQQVGEIVLKVVYGSDGSEDAHN